MVVTFVCGDLSNNKSYMAKLVTRLPPSSLSLLPKLQEPRLQLHFRVSGQQGRRKRSHCHQSLV